MAEQAGVVKQWIPLQRQLVPRIKDSVEAYRRNVRRRQTEAIQNALSKGYLKILDRELILEQQRWPREEGQDSCDYTTEHIQRVSVPSYRIQAIDDMALLSCPLLRICNIPNNLVNDVTAFYGCVNLLKLDLSDNQVEHLPQGDFWFSLSSLRVLYLHGNNISSKSCLQRLNHCPRLHVLTLHSTPLSLMKNYRHYTINSIMTLQALDAHVVSDEEIVENLRLRGKFQTLSPQLKLKLYHSYSQETDCYSELRGVYQLLLAVDSVLAHCSPVHIVQRWVRGWLTRKALAESIEPKIRALLAKYSVNSRRMHTIAPPNTADPNQNFQEIPQSSLMHSSVTHNTLTDTTFKTTLNISLPPPPPSSPLFHSPRTHDRTPSPYHLKHSRSTTLPIETHTLSIDPNTSRLHHSLCVNLNHLHKESTKHPKRQSRKVKHKISLTRASNERGKGSPEKKDESTQEEGIVGTSEGTHEMSVTGHRQEVMIENKSVQAITQLKKVEGKLLRKEEQQIMKTVAKSHEPPSKDNRRIPLPTTIHGEPRLTKNAQAFNRAFQSMTFSTLNAVDQIHRVERIKDDWDRKVAHVERMRLEREKRRQKIHDIHQKTKETIETWRIMEESKLARLQEENIKQVKQSLIDQSLRRSNAHKSRLNDTKERCFADEFVKQTTSIGREVLKDDHEIIADNRRHEIKSQVKQLTELALQRKQEAQEEKEIKETQLVWEGVLAKKELNGKMMQAAVQRLSDAKRRVGRAINRRAAAKASVDKAKEALRNTANKGTHGTTLPPLKLDLRNEVELVEACHDTLQSVTAESISAPYRLRSFTHEANRTWQRGTIVLTERERQSVQQAQFQDGHGSFFPKIKELPQVYPQMRPGRILQQSLVSTPYQSEITDSSLSRTPSTDSCVCNVVP